MSIEIRLVGPDEYATAIEVVSTAFLEQAEPLKSAEIARDAWEGSRTWVAFDAGRACGTFRTFTTELTAPGGGAVETAAVTAVSVLPTHHRRGILSAMAAREHAAIRERGETAAILYASEYRIYGRFGYGPATQSAAWTIATRETGWHGDAPRGVELAPANQTTADAMSGVYEVCRRRQAGEIRRGPLDWQVSAGMRPRVFGEPWKGYIALRRDASGGVDGYVRYTAKSEWPNHEPECQVEVSDLHAVTDAAYAALWRYLAELDLVAKVTAWNRSPAEALPWLATNARAVLPTHVADGIWVRLFDLPRALEARAWERAGSLVIEVADQEAAGGRIRLALDVSPDGARAVPTTRAADLVLPVAALGSVYLGGHRLRDVVLATGSDELRAGALAEADALFRLADQPWCSAGF